MWKARDGIRENPIRAVPKAFSKKYLGEVYHFLEKAQSRKIIGKEKEKWKWY